MDRHLLEIIVDICFLIIELKHQFYNGDSWQVKMVFNWGEEIRHDFYALKKFNCYGRFPKEVQSDPGNTSLASVYKQHTEAQYDGKQKVISLPENLQSALPVLNESLISHL